MEMIKLNRIKTANSKEEVKALMNAGYLPANPDNGQAADADGSQAGDAGAGQETDAGEVPAADTDNGQTTEPDKKGTKKK